MNKGQKVVVAMLAVSVVVLAMVAFAQPKQPTVVSGTAFHPLGTDTVNVYQFFSDGTVKYTRLYFESVGHRENEPGFLVIEP